MCRVILVFPFFVLFATQFLWLATMELPSAVSSVKSVRIDSRLSVQPMGISLANQDCRQEIAQPPSQGKEYILLWVLQANVHLEHPILQNSGNCPGNSVTPFSWFYWCKCSAVQYFSGVFELYAAVANEIPKKITWRWAFKPCRASICDVRTATTFMLCVGTGLWSPAATVCTH